MEISFAGYWSQYGQRGARSGTGRNSGRGRRSHRRFAGTNGEGRRSGKPLRDRRQSRALMGQDQSALHVFLVAGEKSGDRLGVALMRALKSKTAGDVRFSGVGGGLMAGEGLASLFCSRRPRLSASVRYCLDSALFAPHSGNGRNRRQC